MMALAMRPCAAEFEEVFEPRRTAPHPEAVRRTRAPVDFAAVPPSQWAIHDRLENWARWCRGSQKQVGVVGSPMFSLFRSTEAKRVYGTETAVPIDKDDALKIHFAIVNPTFDPQARRALQWNYLRPRNPSGAAKELGVELEGLRDLVRKGREMLIQRNT
jgi:hypothetical protein